MLEVERLQVGYGDAPALWDVSLPGGDGELVAMVGPNGAGKTTFINAVAGLLPARGGTFRFGGRDLSRLPAHEVCRHEVDLVPEGKILSTAVCMDENLGMVCYVPAAR